MVGREATCWSIKEPLFDFQHFCLFKMSIPSLGPTEPRIMCVLSEYFNLLKPTGHVVHHQFNIQQLYVLPTLYLCFVFI